MSPSAVPASFESQPDPDAAPPSGAASSLLTATKQILEMIAAGASLTDILTTLCDAIDRQNPDMMSMVSLEPDPHPPGRPLAGQPDLRDVIVHVLGAEDQIPVFRSRMRVSGCDLANVRAEPHALDGEGRRLERRARNHHHNRGGPGRGVRMHLRDLS